MGEIGSSPQANCWGLSLLFPPQVTGAGGKHVGLGSFEKLVVRLQYGGGSVLEKGTNQYEIPKF